MTNPSVMRRGMVFNVDYPVRAPTQPQTETNKERFLTNTDNNSQPKPCLQRSISPAAVARLRGSQGEYQGYCSDPQDHSDTDRHLAANKRVPLRGRPALKPKPKHLNYNSTNVNRRLHPPGNSFTLQDSATLSLDQVSTNQKGTSLTSSADSTIFERDAADQSFHRYQEANVDLEFPECSIQSPAELGESENIYLDLLPSDDDIVNITESRDTRAASPALSRAHDPVDLYAKPHRDRKHTRNEISAEPYRTRTGKTIPRQHVGRHKKRTDRSHRDTSSGSDYYNTDSDPDEQPDTKQTGLDSVTSTPSLRKLSTRRRVLLSQTKPQSMGDSSIRRQGGIRTSSGSHSNSVIRQKYSTQVERTDHSDQSSGQESSGIYENTLFEPIKSRHDGRRSTKRSKLISLEDQLRELVKNGFRNDDTQASSGNEASETLPPIYSLEGPPPPGDDQQMEQIYSNVHESSTDFSRMAHHSCSGSSNTSDEDNEADDYDDWEYFWAEDEFSDEDAVYSYHQNDDVTDHLLARRKRLMDELVSTEAHYVDKLMYLFKLSLKVEGANQTSQMFPHKIHSKIFQSIEILYRLHSEHMLPALRLRQEQWDAYPRLGDLMARYTPFLSVYKMYTSQYPEANELIKKYKKSSDNFKTLLSNAKCDGECGHLLLQDLLLEPVQRFARYKLMLQAYIRALDHDDEEKLVLTDTVNTIDKQLKECQLILREKDLYGDFSKIQDRLDDMLSVLNPTSKLLKEGKTTQITSRLYLNKKQRYLFLFSDFLLVCAKRISGTYSICAQLDISEIKIRAADHLVSQGLSTDVTMLVRGQEGVLSLLFSDSATKDEWEEVLLQAIEMKIKQQTNRNKNVLQTDKDSSFERAPLWVDDDAAPYCVLCEAKFKTVVRRRHHCRGCGQVVCNKCSSQKMALPYMGGQVARVCDTCFLCGRKGRPELTRRVSTNRRNKSSQVRNVRQDYQIPQRRNAGQDHDTSQRRDAGQDHDSSQRRNAGQHHDTSQRRDAGQDHDTSQRRNAGQDHDSSQRRGAGQDHDTSQRRSAGQDHDSSQRRNAGQDHDTSQRRSAGQDHDTSQRRDAGQDHDTSLRRDAGQDHDTSQRRSADKEDYCGIVGLQRDPEFGTSTKC